MSEQWDRQFSEDIQTLKEQLDKVQRDLYISKQAFYFVAEEHKSMVFSYDIKRQMAFMDKNIARILGLEVVQTGVPYEIVGRMGVSEDTREEYIRIHEEIIEGGTKSSGVIKMTQKDGVTKVFELGLRVIKDENDNPTSIAIGIYRDITEHYIQELEQECYKQLMYSFKAAPFQYDIKQDLLIVFPSSAESIKGTSKERYYPDYLRQVREEGLCSKRDIAALQNFMIYGSEKPIQIHSYSPKTNDMRWYSITGTIVKKEELSECIFGTISDITYIKEKEIAHKKLERVMKSFMDGYTGIFEIDLETDRYMILAMDTNEFMMELPMSGCYSQMNERFVREIVAEKDREICQRFGEISHLRQALIDERRVEIEYMTEGENQVWRRNIYQSVEYRDNVPIKVVLCQIDIDLIHTEKLMHQQAILEAFHYAETANVAKTEFLSRMSHDIRTPMNAIIGMASIASTYIDSRERVEECLNKILGASKHLLSLINEILDMSKIESGKMELHEDGFSITDLIDNVAMMIMPQMNEHMHNFTINMNDLKNEYVIGDSLRIQQILINLLSNAAKYTPDGGEIKFYIKENQIKNLNYEEYEFVLEDNGIGMTEEFQKVIFEPFSRAEDSRISQVTGTGLGMAIVCNIVRMMNGDIQVASKLNEGSHFCVKLPLKQQDKSSNIIEELQDHSVLVVDDDESICKSVCMILEDIGMKGEWCLSGQEAIERIAEGGRDGADYYAVICDLKMPDMDGVKTTKEIRRLVGNDMPILMISGYDWSDFESEIRAAGVDTFIAKPVFKSRLINGFRETLKKEKEEGGGSVINKVDLSGKRVLLVEDNEINAEIATEILEMTGVKVSWARDGQVGVDSIKASEEGYYAIIFMDIQMPILDGYSAARAIRNLDREDVKQMPIVAMTANAFTDDVIHAKNAGMDAHIAKPIDFEKLEEVLKRYVR